MTHNASDKTITLQKGHSYSLVFSGTASVAAKKANCTYGVSLIDGHDSSSCMFATQTYVNSSAEGMTSRLTVAYNTIYTAATEDITLQFAYNRLLIQDTDLKASNYRVTILALD